MALDEKAHPAGEISRGEEAQEATLPTVSPDAEKATEAASSVHPAVYVAVWIALSSSVILFNKWILHTLDFHFPIFLTTWHLLFATFATQLLARTTKMLDGRKKVKMTGRLYLRAIVPIGVFFSLSLICGNVAYLTLSVAFIQMLKATTPVAVLLASWSMGTETADMTKLAKVGIIVLGIIIASFGEIKFVLAGFLFQVGGIIFESIRLVMVQRLLNSADLKMDPLVSLYYFAPVCAIMNSIVCIVVELPTITAADYAKVGAFTFLANALVAFALNVSVVLLIGRTSSLVLTLCGVLKDILLVIASIIIWGTQISLLQCFGYAIALAGLVYYKVGLDKLVETYAGVAALLGEYSNRKPFLKKLLLIITTIGIFAFVLSTVMTTFFPGKINILSELYGKYAPINS